MASPDCGCCFKAQPCLEELHIIRGSRARKEGEAEEKEGVRLTSNSSERRSLSAGSSCQMARVLPQLAEEVCMRPHFVSMPPIELCDRQIGCQTHLAVASVCASAPAGQTKVSLPW